MTGLSSFGGHCGRPAVLLVAVLLSGSLTACGQGGTVPDATGPTTSAAPSASATGTHAATGARSSTRGPAAQSTSTSAGQAATAGSATASGPASGPGRAIAGSAKATGSGESARPTPGRGAVVPSVDVSSRPPVDLAADGDLGDGLAAKVSSVRFTTQQGRGAGEVSGPAVVLGVTVRNGGSAPVDLDGATVTLAYGDDVQAAPFDSAPAKPFNGPVAPGASSTGTYVFALPADQRGRTALTITAGAGKPVAVYTGDLAKAAS